MLRIRNVSKTTASNGSPSSQKDVSPGALHNAVSSPQRVKNSYTPPLPLVLLLVWCMFQSIRNFQFLIHKNLNLDSQQFIAPTTTTTSLRAGASVAKDTHNHTKCPDLPDRLLHHHTDLVSPPLIPLTKEEVKRQRSLMIKARLGTMGDVVLACPDHHRSRVDSYGRIRTSYSGSTSTHSQVCRGILKIYQSKVVYRHVKRCLTLLQGTGIAPRILYSDDATHTLVEEDQGWLTMRNSPIPVDFDQQLRRILCILRQHSIVHRDLTYPNIVIDEVTGKLSIIDMGDAFVAIDGWYNWQNYNWRNLQNLWNIWWHQYDEEAKLEDLITRTIPEITGDRQWRPPVRHWESLSQNKIGSLLLGRELLK
jgi:hypothetical protein